MTPPLVMRLFGAMEVQVRGLPLPLLRTRKGHWILALLTLRAPVPVLREWLAATLWPESAGAQALANLRVSLADLRRALGPEAHRLHAPTPRVLALDLTDAFVDLPAFDMAVARDDEAALQAAVALYRGPLLEECAEPWVIPMREAREQRYLEALEFLAATACGRHDWSTAERHLRAAVATDPLRESAQRALMRALAAAGSYAAALHVYQDLCRHMHRELNALPDAETTALFQALRADQRPTTSDQRRAPNASGSDGSVRSDRSVQSRGHHALPLRLTRFVGREREIRELVERLAEVRLVTLTGAGGCGKSRLAVEVAVRLAGGLADGVRYIELAALADPVRVSQAIAARLGVRGDDEGSCVAALVTHLASRELLLVLDNCEHLLDGCVPLVASLLAACPEQRILATSREALGIAGEVLHRVPNLALPAAGRRGKIDEAALEAIGCSEAVELFVDRASRAAAGFALDPANAVMVATICRRLDGMPLAIELAAARLRAMPLEELHQRLDDRFRLLLGSDRTALPRHRTLQAAIDWSYRLLSEPERRVLRRLSVFAGGWTLEAAEAVGVDLDLLTALVDKSLVDYEERDGAGRYRLLETVRQYGRERLREAGEEHDARRAHFEHYFALVERAAPALPGPGQPEWTRRLDAEFDNLQAALDWSREVGETEMGLRMGATLRYFWLVRGYIAEGRRQMEALLAQASTETPEQPSVRGRALVCVSSLAFMQSDFAPAERWLQESLAIGRRIEDSWLIRQSLHYLAAITEQRQENAVSLAYHEEELKVAREAGDEVFIALVLACLGNRALNLGDLATARSYIKDAVMRAREQGDQRLLGYTTLRRGQVAMLEGEFAQARSDLEAGLALAQEAAENSQNLCACRIQLGVLARREGDLAAARRSLEEALVMARERNMRVELLQALRARGEVAEAEDDPEAADAHFRESLTVAQTIGQRRGVMWALYRLAALAARVGQPERAARLAGAATALREAIGLIVPPIEQPEIDGTIATAREALGEAAFARAWDEARAMTAERAIELALANGDGSPTLGEQENAPGGVLRGRFVSGE